MVVAKVRSESIDEALGVAAVRQRALFSLTGMSRLGVARTVPGTQSLLDGHPSVGLLTVHLVPLRAEETGPAKESVHPIGVAVSPEREVRAQREIGLALRPVTIEASFPQDAELRAVPCGDGALDQVVIGERALGSLVGAPVRRALVPTTAEVLRVDLVDLGLALLDCVGSSIDPLTREGQVAARVVHLDRLLLPSAERELPL